MPAIKLTPSRLAWLAAYAVTLALTVWGMFEFRHWALPELATDQATVEWDAWRKASAEQSATGPVRRDPLTTSEPPGLTLLRDHFPAVVGMTLVFNSLMFGTVLLAVRVFRPTRRRGLDLDAALNSSPF